MTPNSKLSKGIAAWLSRHIAAAWPSRLIAFAWLPASHVMLACASASASPVANSPPHDSTFVTTMQTRTSPGTTWKAAIAASAGLQMTFKSAFDPALSELTAQARWKLFRNSAIRVDMGLSKQTKMITLLLDQKMYIASPMTEDHISKSAPWVETKYKRTPLGVKMVDGRVCHAVARPVYPSRYRQDSGTRQP